MFWTQIGLQHGAEMAALCASINSRLCPTNNPSAITNYAMQQAYGLSLPTTDFTYSMRIPTKSPGYNGMMPPGIPG